MSLVEVTDADFDNFVNENSYKSLLIIDFYKSQGCGRCELHIDVLRNLEKEFLDSVKFARMDVVKNPIAPMRFRLVDFPTIGFFRRGRVELASPGVKGAGTLRKLIHEKLADL
ncbi:MAG: thioredoxin family protein [Candidatus Hodarchaeota archaeon]